jgi:hypothetical protein
MTEPTTDTDTTQAPEEEVPAQEEGTFEEGVENPDDLQTDPPPDDGDQLEIKERVEEQLKGLEKDG